MSDTSLLHSPDTWIATAFVGCIALALKYAIPALNKALDGRAETIRFQLEQAKRLREDAQALLASYQREREEKLKEAEAIIATAQRDAAAMRARAEEELNASVARRQKQATDKIARAEAEAIATLRTQMVNAATQATRTLVQEQLHAKAEDPAVTRAISSIAQQIH